MTIIKLLYKKYLQMIVEDRHVLCFCVTVGLLKAACIAKSASNFASFRQTWSNDFAVSIHIFDFKTQRIFLNIYFNY